MDQDGSAQEDTSVAELLKRLSEQTSTLVRQEFELAKAELGEKGKQAGFGAGLLGGAGALGFYALGALTAALVLALATAFDGWLAALIVGLAYGAIAGGLALAGKAKLRQGAPPVPQQAVESFREDVAVTKRRAMAGRR